MSNVHMVVGTIVVLLFIVNLAMYVVNLLKGRLVAYHRLVSMAAAGFLLLQYVLGFSLLADHSITWIHPVLALLAIGSVGAEHMTTAQEPSPRRRGFLGLFCTSITVILTLVAYSIGQAN